MPLPRPPAIVAWLAPLIAIASIATASCGDTNEPGDGRLQVVASTTILADWVAQVGGDHVSVSSMVPRSTDVHSYVPVPGAIERIADAELVFMAGESFESSFDDAVAANARGTIVTLSDGIALRPFPAGLAHDDAAEADSGHLDPHFYLDIELSITAVEHIRDALGEADAANEADYEANAATYIEKLRALDQEIGARMAALPENRQLLVTFHDAYGYFASRYGLELLGFVVESPEEQPAAAQIAELVDEIRARNVRYIFTEPQFDSRIIKQLASDTGAEVREIPSDALADAYPDYVSFMRAIADGIAR